MVGGGTNKFVVIISQTSYDSFISRRQHRDKDHDHHYRLISGYVRTQSLILLCHRARGVGIIMASCDIIFMWESNAGTGVEGGKFTKCGIGRGDSITEGSR